MTNLPPPYDDEFDVESRFHALPPVLLFEMSSVRSAALSDQSVKGLPPGLLVSLVLPGIYEGIVPTVRSPAKYEFPVVVAPPEMVSPPVCAPVPIVDDAMRSMPEVVALVPATGCVHASYAVNPLEPPKHTPSIA
mgnify:CR=1 FL=1